jgi:hypothetical protein
LLDEAVGGRSPGCRDRRGYRGRAWRAVLANSCAQARFLLRLKGTWPRNGGRSGMSRRRTSGNISPGVSQSKDVVGFLQELRAPHVSEQMHSHERSDWADTGSDDGLRRLLADLVAAATESGMVQDAADADRPAKFPMDQKLEDFIALLHRPADAVVLAHAAEPQRRRVPRLVPLTVWAGVSVLVSFGARAARWLARKGGTEELKGAVLRHARAAARDNLHEHEPAVDRACRRSSSKPRRGIPIHVGSSKTDKGG